MNILKFTAQYTRRQARYSRKGTGGKIALLISLLIVLIIALAATYFGKYYIVRSSLGNASDPTSGALLIGVFCLLLAVGFFFSDLVVFIQYAMIGFRNSKYIAHQKSSSDSDVHPDAIDKVFGCVNLIFVALLILSECILIIANI